MDLHQGTVETITDTTEAGFEAIVDFLYADSPNTWWEGLVLPQLRSYATQMTTLIINYPLAIGAFFDAQTQQETMTRMQVLTAQTARDQIPAVSMCEFATLSKSLAATKTAKDDMIRAVSLQNLKRVSLNRDFIGSENVNEDALTRFEQFKAKYCFSTLEAAGLPQASDHAGLLKGICTASFPTRKRNRDINFTQLLGTPKTISATLYPTAPSSESFSQFEDIVALSRNLYGDVPTEPLAEGVLKNTTEGLARLQLIKKRALQAKRNVAQHSFANYVGLKAPTDNTDDSELSVKPHMQNLLITLGIDGSSNNEFNDYFALTGGASSLASTSPSYWAQMEILTKTLYQNPKFFINLYDNPANVKRQQAAMKAIDLMQERDIHETALRSETLLSLWLDSALEDYGEDITQEWANMKAAKK